MDRKLFLKNLALLLALGPTVICRKPTVNKAVLDVQDVTSGQTDVLKRLIRHAPQNSRLWTLLEVTTR